MGIPMPTKLSAKDKIAAAKAAAQAKAQAIRDTRAAKKAAPMLDKVIGRMQKPTIYTEPVPRMPLVNDAIGGPTSGPGAPLPQPAGATSNFQGVQSTVNGMPPPDYGSMTMKKGGKVSASSRADGIAQRGKTRGKYI